MRKLFVIVFAASAVAGQAAAEDAVAELRNPDGEVVGRAAFHQAPQGVIIVVDAANLPPGGHGIHLHTAGSCAPDFTAAKGHVNPSERKHGLLNPEGPDSGDLPNLHVAADGTAKAEFYTTRIAVESSGGADDQPALLDEDGAAVVVHANPDDHITQPIGGAGGRIACGVVEKA